jgi:hypothetical protein
MELVFRILAVILIGIAAYFLWRGNGDAAFIAGVFGAVSFFLTIRFQVRGRLTEREIENEARWRREEAEKAREAQDEQDAEEAQEEETAQYSETARLSDNLDAAHDLSDARRTTDDRRETRL